jgi:carbonic anhydrase
MPIEELIEGNGRFASSLPEDKLKQQAQGQSPKYVVIACSDSRCGPETITGTNMPGEMFVIRAVGGHLDTAGLASVKYGVEHLHVHDVIFISHTQCGAVKAAQSAIASHANLSGTKDPLSKTIEKIAKQIKPQNADASRIDEAVMDNAKREIKKLIKFMGRDPDLNAASRISPITVHHLNYDISTAKLRAISNTVIQD